MHIGPVFRLFSGRYAADRLLPGRSFASSIESIDHWVAFILLAFIGGKMIWEALKKEDDTDKNRDDYRIQTLTLLSLATSIDALAVGVTFAFLQVAIVPAVLLIAAVTFVLTLCGFWLGTVFGAETPVESGAVRRRNPGPDRVENPAGTPRRFLMQKRYT